MEQALAVLELPAVPLPTQAALRKQYLRLAMRYHPDKHVDDGSQDKATQKFQEVAAAYALVDAQLFGSELGSNSGSSNNSTPVSWLDMVRQYLVHVDMSWLAAAVCQLLTLGPRLMQTQSLDHESLLAIYAFVLRHQAALHVSAETLNLLREQLQSRLHVVRLNPSLTDLCQHNVYKLRLEGEEGRPGCRLVPLWSEQSYFEARAPGEKALLVLCEPELPPHMWIDADHQLCIRVDLSWTTLGHHVHTQTAIHLHAGLRDGDAPLAVAPNQVRCTTEVQLFHFPAAGLTHTVTEDWRDISCRDDVFVFVQLIDLSSTSPPPNPM